MDALTVGAGAFPLMLASEGETVRILSFPEGRGIDRKLADLGLPIGSEFTVVTRQGGGQMIVARDGLRIALGAGLAHRILVVRVEPQ